MPSPRLRACHGWMEHKHYTQQHRPRRRRQRRRQHSPVASSRRPRAACEVWREERRGASEASIITGSRGRRIPSRLLSFDRMPTWWRQRRRRQPKLDQARAAVASAGGRSCDRARCCSLFGGPWRRRGVAAGPGGWRAIPSDPRLGRAWLRRQPPRRRRQRRLPFFPAAGCGEVARGAFSFACARGGRCFFFPPESFALRARRAAHGPWNIPRARDGHPHNNNNKKEAHHHHT